MHFLWVILIFIPFAFPFLSPFFWVVVVGGGGVCVLYEIPILLWATSATDTETGNSELCRDFLC